MRLFKESTDKDSPPSKTQITIGDLKFEAANEGSWGESLIVEIDFDIRQESSDQYKLDKEKMFNLSVHESSVQSNKRKIINSESFTKLTLEDDKNRVDRILELESKLLRYKAGEKLPSDLSAVKPLAQNGKVSYSIIESIDSLKKKIDRLSKDKNDEKKKLEKQLKALKSSDGESLDADCFIGPGKEDRNEGIYALEDIKPQIFNLMCIPPYNADDVDHEVVSKAAEYCEKKRAFLIVGPPSSWENKDDAINGLN